MNLSGKLAIVTGATSGIGHATAMELSKLGAAVVISGRRREKLEQLAKSISGEGRRALAVAGDASKEGDVEELVTRAIDFSSQLGFAGRIDICIVNAGRGLAGGLLASDQKEWREVFETNVLGAAALMRRVGGIMVGQQSGDIVVLGSVAGHNISPFSGFYGGSKWAIGSIAEAFRREVCGRKVRVSLIKPAIVVSEFQQVAGYTQENFYKGVDKFGKLLVPQDVADAIAYIVTRPPHVHVNEMVVRPVGQDYP